MQNLVGRQSQWVVVDSCLSLIRDTYVSVESKPNNAYGSLWQWWRHWPAAEIPWLGFLDWQSLKSGVKQYDNTNICWLHLVHTIFHKILHPNTEDPGLNSWNFRTGSWDAAINLTRSAKEKMHHSAGVVVNTLTAELKGGDLQRSSAEQRHRLQQLKRRVWFPHFTPRTNSSWYDLPPFVISTRERESAAAKNQRRLPECSVHWSLMLINHFFTFTHTLIFTLIWNAAP